MTLVVEDGTGLPDANGYVDVAYADTYHGDRGNEAWLKLTTPKKEQAIVRASQYEDSVFNGDWRGQRGSSDQGMDWPRNYAYDELGAPYDGVPIALEQATSEYALRSAAEPLDPDPEYDASGRVVTGKLERVEGAVTEETRYEQGGRTVAQRRYPEADRLLQPLLKNANGRAVRL